MEIGSITTAGIRNPQAATAIPPRLAITVGVLTTPASTAVIDFPREENASSMAIPIGNMIAS